MKRFWIGTAVVAVVGFVFCLLTVEAEWRSPSGSPGKVQVHYTIPEKGPRGDESVSFTFWIAGHVERVQIVPISYHNKYGFVALYIKTTEGWYESPRASLDAPVDWKRGVDVHFHYPEGMVLRAQTRSPVRGYGPAFGHGWLRWRGTPLEFGDYLGDGDIAGVRFCNADRAEVTVHRTNGLTSSGGSSRPIPRMAVEVTVFDR